MIAKGGYVYILTNINRSVLYIGVTSNLYVRVSEHKKGVGSLFTKKYNCTVLLYYEFFQSIEEAIAREKKLKKWKRAYKENAINEFNPAWQDLFDQIEDFQ